MFEKLEQIETKYEELTAQLALPEVLSDRFRYQKTVKAHRELQGIVDKYRKLKGIEKSILDTTSLLREEQSDSEFKALAHEELEGLEQQQVKLEEEVKVPASPQRSERQKKHHSGDSSRHGRR